MNLSCHCGNITISVDKNPDTLTNCNCSVCSRYASLWGGYKPDEVSIKSESDDNNNYSWGDKNVDFKRCGKCGCVTHYTTTEKVNDPIVGVNFRMAAPKEIASIRIRQFDGADTWKFID